MSNEDEKVFRKVPITWVPFLDEDPANPVCGIRWKRVSLDELVSSPMRDMPKPDIEGEDEH